MSDINAMLDPIAEGRASRLVSATTTVLAAIQNNPEYEQHEQRWGNYCVRKMLAAVASAKTPVQLGVHLHAAILHVPTCLGPIICNNPVAVAIDKFILAATGVLDVAGIQNSGNTVPSAAALRMMWRVVELTMAVDPKSDAGSAVLTPLLMIDSHDDDYSRLFTVLCEILICAWERFPEPDDALAIQADALDVAVAIMDLEVLAMDWMDKALDRTVAEAAVVGFGVRAAGEQKTGKEGI